ncbi:MAG: hypothetical protein ACOX0U_08970 [Oscillospiraceae bacterium]
MIGLLHVEYTAGRFPRSAVFTPCEIKGGAFCDVCIRLPLSGPPRARDRRIRRAARKMAAYGIRRVVPPRELFPYWETLLEYKISPISIRPLLRQMATPIALFYLHETGRARRSEAVVLQAQRMEMELFRVAEQLCRKVRNVAVQIPDSEALEDRLQTEYGVPAMAGRTGFTKANLVLLFSVAEKGETVVPGQGALFYFGEGTPRLQTDRRVLQWAELAVRNGDAPSGPWDQTSLLAALWEMGHISARELEIIQLS